VSDFNFERSRVMEIKSHIKAGAAPKKKAPAKKK
jgi:hypothetical protein